MCAQLLGVRRLVGALVGCELSQLALGVEGLLDAMVLRKDESNLERQQCQKRRQVAALQGLDSFQSGTLVQRCG